MANVKNITELPVAESAEGLNLIVNDGGAAKQIAASAVGAQADWNQNDPTKPDYVKNRPFWTDDPVEKVFINEQALTINDDLYAQFNEPFTLIDGETYIVTFNGVEYECVAKYGSEWECYYVGNGNMVDESTDDIHPFVIDSYSDGEIYLNVTEAGDYTASIRGIVCENHKIDKKYLPEKKWFFADQEVLDLDKVAKKFFGSDNMFHIAADIAGGEPENFVIVKEDWDAFIAVAKKYPVCIARVPFGSYLNDHVAINDAGDDYVYLMMNYFYFGNIKNNMHSLSYVQMNIKLEYNTEISAVTISKEFWRSYDTDFILSETIYE